MLAFHPLHQQTAAPARQAALLRAFQDVLERDGMASMDEYGDMLKWALPSRDGNCRYFHVFHPGFCSFEDRFRGTIHDHGGQIHGTILAGHLRHFTYEATPDPDGDRTHKGQTYRLQRHEHAQEAGISYTLPAHVPHWLAPTQLTITYFEEEDNDEMGDLVDPDADADQHRWDQRDADALLPALQDLIRERLQMLDVAATPGRSAVVPA